MKKHIFNLPGFDYESILKSAKSVDRINFMDIAHDHILTGRSMRALKFNYRTANAIDYTQHQDSCLICSQCNEIKPVAAFRTKIKPLLKCTENVCCQCASKNRQSRKKQLKNHIMKLIPIEFEPQKDAVLRFTKNGVFHLSDEMCTLIGFKEGLKLHFLKDQDYPKNWYICLDPENGFDISVRMSNDGKYNYRQFQKRTFHEKFIKELSITEHVKCVKIGNEIVVDGISYYPLIKYHTKTPLSK